jgi:hypothetical protein
MRRSRIRQSFARHLSLSIRIDLQHLLFPTLSWYNRREKWDYGRRSYFNHGYLVSGRTRKCNLLGYVISSPYPHSTNILFSPTHSLLPYIVPKNSWTQMVPQNDTNGIFLAIILSTGIHLPTKITEPDVQDQWSQFLRQSIVPLISEAKILSGLNRSHQPLDHSILPSLSNALQSYIIDHTILQFNENVTTSNYRPSASSSAHSSSLRNVFIAEYPLDNTFYSIRTPIYTNSGNSSRRLYIRHADLPTIIRSNHLLETIRQWIQIPFPTLTTNIAYSSFLRQYYKTSYLSQDSTNPTLHSTRSPIQDHRHPHPLTYSTTLQTLHSGIRHPPLH